jgi:hypothetical protein
MAATCRRAFATLSIIVIAATALHARQPKDDSAIVQFQRAADSYAFQHRQTERRGAALVPLIEGAFFTPQVAAALRDRIRASGCEIQNAGDRDFVVPRVNATSEGTSPLPPCLSSALPKLPPELEYRAAGVALILADAHLHIVVDILHAAFPQPATPKP